MQRGCLAAFLYTAGTCLLLTAFGVWFLYNLAVGAWDASRTRTGDAIGPSVALCGLLMLGLALKLHVSWSHHELVERIKELDV